METSAADPVAFGETTTETLSSINSTSEDGSEVSHSVVESLSSRAIDEEKLLEDNVIPEQAPSQVEDGCIEPAEPISEIPLDPYPLPDELELEWWTIDLKNDKELQAVQVFLMDNYVEDEDDGSFRLRYSSEFLRWALCPPGYFKDWHIAIREQSTKEIIGFVSAIPITVRVREHTLHAREVNFLCVHKKMRKKRLTPLLLKEATRRGQLEGVQQALWTAGSSLPSPISACRYYHRQLNYPKLVEVEFARKPKGNETMESMIERCRVPDEPAMLNQGLREMEERDVPEVTSLYASYMTRFDLALELTQDEIRHQLIGGSNTAQEDRAVWTYVVEDPDTHAITDFFSFYSLPYTVLSPSAPQHKTLDIAFLYYYATNVGIVGADAAADKQEQLKGRLVQLMTDALVLAKQLKFDVFNALTLMDNVEFLADLKFNRGTGLLKYYLDNWKTAPLAGEEPIGDVSAGRGIAVVMV